MRRLWRLRVVGGVLVVAGGVALAVLAYLAGEHRLALFGIFLVWGARIFIARRGHRDLSPGWRRLRNYVFLQQLAIQFSARMAGVLVIVAAGFADLDLLELLTIAVVIHLISRHYFPVLLRRAFRARVTGRHMRDPDARRGMVPFDASDSRWRRRTRRYRRLADWFEPAFLLAIIVFGGDGLDAARWVAIAWLVVGVFNLALLVGTAVRTVQLKAYVRKEEAVHRFIEDFEPTFLVYFSAGGRQSLYQIDQWVPFLESSGHRLLVVTRERRLLGGLGRMTRRSPVVWIQRLVDLERLMQPSVKGAIYVNNGMRNGHLLRFNELTHVQLLHGESDKGASASKATRAYDVIAVAGRAAIERYALADVAIPDSQFRVIGRPSTDLIDRVEPGTEVATLLYAPTWEGHDPLSDHTSVRDIGVPSIRWMLEHRPDVRLIVKPHPLTGSVDDVLAARLTEMADLLIEANERQGRSDDDAHLYLRKADGVGIVDAFNMCDALLCDISSVPADFLRSDKPMFISDVKRAGAEAVWDEFPTTRGSYIVDGSAEGWENAAAAFEADRLADERAATRRHVLGDFEGSSTDQLHALLDDIAGYTPERVWDLGDELEDEDDDGDGDGDDEGDEAD